MCRVFLWGFFAVLLTLKSAAADQQEKSAIYAALADYYCVEEDSVANLAELGISDEDLAVVFEIATGAEVDCRIVADKRLEGKNWTNIGADFGWDASHFYVPVNGAIESPRYLPIYAKFRVTPRVQWTLIILSDEDISSLVNLRFISDQFDYSPYQVMAMTDYGKNYAEICRQLSAVDEDLNHLALASEKSKDTPARR